MSSYQEIYDAAFERARALGEDHADAASLAVMACPWIYARDVWRLAGETRGGWAVKARKGWREVTHAEAIKHEAAGGSIARMVNDSGEAIRVAQEAGRRG